MEGTIIASTHLSDAQVVLILAGFGLVGLAFGRFLLLPLPIIVWLAWYWWSGPHSPDDDVSGPFAFGMTVLSFAATLIGVLAHRGVRVLRRGRLENINKTGYIDGDKLG
jgi:hypothetical protein